MHALTALRIVWKNACLHYIIGKGYPFPKYSLDGLSVWELEQYVCHSAELAKKWLSGSWTPRRSWLTSATANISVTDTRLIPGSRGTLLITLSKTIWSVITLGSWSPSYHQRLVKTALLKNVVNGHQEELSLVVLLSTWILFPRQNWLSLQ